jgi:hypothetical protein
VAESWGDQIWTPSGNYWQCGVNAWVTGTDDEYAYVHVEAKVYTRWPFNVYANGSAGSTNDDTRYWSGSLDQGKGESTIYISYDTWFARRYGQDRTVEAWARYNVTGGYGNGTSSASVSIDIPARPYSTPRPPRNLKAAYARDTSQKLTWDADYTGSDDAYPWSGIVVARSVDGGGYSDMASLGWDATNYTDSSTSAGHSYAYQVRSYNPAGSAIAQSGTVYTTPTPPTKVSATAMSATTVSVGASGQSAYVDGYEVQHRAGASGTWGETKRQATLPVAMPSVAGDNWYRVRAYKGSLYSAYAMATSAITTIAQPLAPSVSAPTVAATGTSAAVTWTPNHPDHSDVKASQVEVTRPDGTTSTVSVTGTATATTVASLARGTYRLRVRTKGLWAESNGGWGEWSAYSVLGVYDLPAVSLSSPAATVDKMPVSVAWSASDSTGVTRQVVTISDSSGSVLLSRAVPVGATSLSVTSDQFTPQNGSTYTVAVTVTGGSSLSRSASRAFKVSWAQPNAPVASVTVDPSLFAIVRVGEGTGSGARAESFSVERVDPDGGSTFLGEGLLDGQALIDYLAPLNVDYSYRVTAHASSGTATSVLAHAHVESFGDEAYNFGANASACVRLGFDASVSQAVQHGGETFHFALGPDTPSLPTFYPDGTTDITGQRSYVAWGGDAYRRISGIVRDQSAGTCWLRDFYGGVHRVCAKFTLGYSAGTYDQFSVSVDVTETVWEEPVRG